MLAVVYINFNHTSNGDTKDDMNMMPLDQIYSCAHDRVSHGLFTATVAAVTSVLGPKLQNSILYAANNNTECTNSHDA